MKNKYNINLINQYKNEDLYEEEIFNFILQNTEINELKNSFFEIDYRNATSVKGNFEAFLNKQIEYSSPIKKEMNKKMNEKWGKELLNPLYFVSINKKEYILEESGYEIFKNVENYLRKVVKNNIQKINDYEEKFVIDWIFKNPPKLILRGNEKDEINVLYNILLNQKEYLNKKNNGLKTNIFFENMDIKKILGLFSQEQRENLMESKITYEEIIDSYYKRLLKQKHFDLAKQLEPFDSKEIFNYLKENISEKSEDWFKIFIEKGSGLSLLELNNKISTSKVFYGKKGKKSSKALEGGVELLKNLFSELKNENIVTLLLIAIIEEQNERLYIELRSFTEIPDNEKLKKYMNSKTINKKPIEIIEKEVMKNKLEKDFPAKEKIKPLKI